MKQILSLLLLCPLALQAGPTQSILLNPPSKVEIAATAHFKKQDNHDQLPKEQSYTSYLPLEKSFFSLQERTRNFLAADSSSNLYTTALALQNVTRAGISIECTTTHKDDSDKKHVWPLIIPFDQEFEETIQLDLLDDAGEKIKVTIKSTITE